MLSYLCQAVGVGFECLFCKYDTPGEIVCEAFSSFRFIASISPWPGTQIRLRSQNEQFSYYIESSPMLNDANLFNTELFARLDMIASVMNTCPIKKSVKLSTS